MSSRYELKFTDSADQNGFFRRFASLAEKPHQTIRVVDKGDYYTVVGKEDSNLVADRIYRTKGVIKESNRTPYVTLSTLNFDSLIEEFVINNGYKIELYDKFWKLLNNISPGNLQGFDENLNSSSRVSVIAALKFVDKSDGKYFGLSYINIDDKQIGYCEFIDNDLYSNLESVLIQLNVKECLLAGLLEETLSKDRSLTKLIQVINRCDVAISEVKPSVYSTKDVDQDLEKILTEDAFLTLTTSEVQSKVLSLGCAAALINYLNILNDESNYGSFHLQPYQLDNYMKLDLSAFKAMSLFPSVRDQGIKNSSIFGILNHCKSAEGARLLSQWIKQPLTSQSFIKNRHLLVGFLMEDSQTRQSLQDDFLCFVPDVKRLTRKLMKGKASLEDVIRIYQLILKLPEILNILESSLNLINDKSFTFLQNEDELTELKNLVDDKWVNPLKNLYSNLCKLQEMVEATVDLDALDNHKYVIKPEFNPDLLLINEKLELLSEQMSEIHLDSATELGKDPEKKLKLENHPIHSWCMRLTRIDSAVLRNKKHYIELQTVKAGVFFTTKRLRSISDQYAELQTEYNKTQSNVVKEILEISTTYTPLLEKLIGLIAEIDVIVSFAHTSAYAPKSYVRPKMYDLSDASGKTRVKEARHPCLEMQDDISFIANDIELIRNETEFLIITGPNMGGKSTYIKSVGIFSLMAQIGCFVPATSAELCIVDAILARVGAGDSQLKGISTFMAEMLEISSILKTATKNSLIIIDELGRGTSTYDGFGLAYAISENIAKEKKCFTMFATHFHELTALSEKIPTVKNLHVVAHVSSNNDLTEPQDSNDITLLYKVEPGISDQSFGIHVAEVVQFPQKIVSMSKRKASELEDLGGKVNSADDPYVADKRTKCDPGEIQKGSQLLKTILKEWKDSVTIDSMTNEEIVEELKNLFGKTYSEEIKNDKFLKEVLNL